MSEMSEKREERVKIGARVLDKERLGKLLSQYENIAVQLNKMRDNAKWYSNIKQAQDKILIENRGEVNNIISILGKRGAGKTSVLLTIRNWIQSGKIGEEDSELMDTRANDIILPTIIPETMGDNSNLMGWILGSFEDKVNKIEEEI